MKRQLLAAALAIGIPAIAVAQFAKPEDAIRYRQSALFIMGEHFGRIGAMATDKIPFDPAVAKSDAAVIATVSRLPWAGFVPGSDKGATKARPEIWANPDKFAAAQKRLADAVPTLVAAADTGDQAKIRGAVTEVFSACRNCHGDFRAR
ncbi:MAG: cytochrome c [Lautropia sp.]